MVCVLVFCGGGYLIICIIYLYLFVIQPALGILMALVILFFIYFLFFVIQPALGILMALVILERTIKSVLGVNND